MQEDIYQEIEKLVRQHPNKAIELFEDWADKMPEEAKESIENKLYGASIRTKEKMDEAIKLAERYTNMVKSWNYDTFKQVLSEMNITTDGKKYTCYDINFVAVLKYLIHIQGRGVSYICHKVLHNGHKHTRYRALTHLKPF